MKAIEDALRRLPAAQRDAWMREARRLARIVESYGAIKPKRLLIAGKAKYEFAPAVIALCEEARCKERVIIDREPHRANRPSPYTLDRWFKDYRRDGLASFIRSPSNVAPGETDARHARISSGAVEYINSNWRKYQSPHILYQDLKEEAERAGWTIPSQSWLYRRWRKITYGRRRGFR